MSDLVINPGVFAKYRSWKNVGLMNQILKKLVDDKFVKPGDIVTTAQLEQIVRDNKLESRWILDGKAEDEFGLRRTIGDTVGGHGLKLINKNGRVTIPDRLPVTDGDMVVKEAIYGEVNPETGKTSTYEIYVTQAAGVFIAAVRFISKNSDRLYTYKTSDIDQMINTLNPMAWDGKTDKAMQKKNLSKLIESIRTGTTVLIHVNASIYQKIYGAHNPGKHVFQPQA